MMIGHYALGTLHLQAGLAAMLPWGRERESGNDCRGAGARGHGGYAERESVRPAVRPSVWPADVID